MSELEDPAVTLLRLITTKIRIIRDNKTAAKILTTEQALDRELLLKEYDAQITLALHPNFEVQDQKLNLSGDLRRQLYFFKCTSHSIDKPSVPGSDLGRVMRNKVAAQIKAIIRENRTLPYQTIYNYAGIGYPTGDPHKAFAIGSASELPPSNPSWTELTNLEYQNIWYPDDIRHSKSHNNSNEYGLMLFRFKIAARAQCVKQIMLSFEGYGTAPTGNGLTVKAWNHTASAWQQTQLGNERTDETLTITITENLTDFIDTDGYVWLLARTTNPSDGVVPAVINCDFVQLTIQVYGIAYCDIVSYRFIDVTDVKPVLYKVEFILKGWAFETISG